MVYVTIGASLIFKYGRPGKPDMYPGPIWRDFTVFLFVMALCYISGILTRVWAPGADVSLAVDMVVMKLYLVSAVVPCFLLRRKAFADRPWTLFHVAVVLVAALFLISDVLISLGHGTLSRGILCRGAVAVNLVVFLVSIRYAVIFLGRDDVLNRALGRELLVNVAVLSLYNFLFLLYSFHLHIVLDYFLLVTGFAVVHTAMVLCLMQGRSLQACILPALSGLTGQDSGYDRLFISHDDGQQSGQETAGSPDSTTSLKDRLLGYFECEKPYLSKNLTMEEVAMRLFTNKTYLSKTINVEMNKNFRELVNYFRVKEAIRIFHEDDTLSMSELRDRCGFNNNASFTSAFKLNTGYTPGEWCRDMKNRKGKAVSKVE